MIRSICRSVLLVALASSLLSCGSVYKDVKYQRTSQIGPVVWPKGESLDSWACDPPLGAASEVGLALEAVLRAFHEKGLIEYSNANLEKLLLYERKGPLVCFVTDNSLGMAGRNRSKGVWIALTDRDEQPVAIRDSALAHELVHQILWRSCLLDDPKTFPRCPEDGGHEDPRFWGPGSVAERAEQIWRAGR